MQKMSSLLPDGSWLPDRIGALTSQELHTDADNGPFSFTLSLTRWDGRRFTGGETVLLAPRVLDYWAASLSSEVRLTCVIYQRVESAWG